MTAALGQWLVVLAVFLTAASGVPALFVRRASGPGAERLATAMVVLGCASGIAGALLSLAGHDTASIDLPWAVPGGRFALRVDAIAAMFLLQIFVVAGLGAIYGAGYWRDVDHPDDARKLRLFYGVLTASLATLVVARSAILFLFGWELMAVAAFFCVTTEDRDPAVRSAGFVYLVATRVSSLCLFALVSVLYGATGTVDFALDGARVSSGAANALFLLALVACGVKAGIMPLHVWLPGAHANAPSHVSALMSGVLIKMGVYGLVRVTSFFPHPPAWWGGLLFGLGVASGVLGVAFAIGQHDIKRLLAYHSVENVGIIVMGLGLALLARAMGAPELALLGLAGALLHTWNHGIFKALLFFGAGSVVHATGTREIDALGGLGKKMPRTALAFLVGAVAICGLPPLNGFVSELFIYLAMLRGVATQHGRAWLAGAFGAPALALIGALAVACFVKVYGAVFLGAPRTARAERAHESGAAMTAPMAALAIACVVIGVAPALVAPVLDRAAAAWAPEMAAAAPPLVRAAPLAWVSGAAGALTALVLALALALRARTRRAPRSETVTWDCGYAAPSSSMQYTSSSFAQMLVELFAWALRPSVHAPRLRAPFPAPSRFHSEVSDVVLERAVLPAARAVVRGFGWFRWVQQGSVHAYLLYMLIALVLAFFGWR
jgi:hydrogenase-4 component B